MNILFSPLGWSKKKENDRTWVNDQKFRMDVIWDSGEKKEKDM